jgi:hypothetical protein
MNGVSHEQGRYDPSAWEISSDFWEEHISHLGLSAWGGRKEV